MNDYLPNCQTFKIVGKDMPGLNDMLNAAKLTISNKRKGNHILTKYELLKRTWLEKISFSIMESGIKPIVNAQIYLELLWEEPNRRRDPDNIAAFIKFILDAMRKCKIIKDDGWKNIHGWNNKFTVSNKRTVTVKIWEVLK